MSNVVPVQTKVAPYGFTMQGDLELLHTLLKHNSLYDIPDHARESIINDCTAVLKDTQATVATRIAASKVLLECDKRNIDMLKMVVPKQVIHRTVTEMTTEELEEALDEYNRIRQKVPELIESDFNGKIIPPMERTYVKNS